MRRRFGVLAVVSSSIACGGFLGFGGDDDPPAPVTDAGVDTGDPDVVSAAGDSAPPDGGLDCTVRTFAFGTDAGIAGSDWSMGTLQGSGTLTVEDGGLVSRAGIDNGAVEQAQAVIFATRDGNIGSIHCTARVSVSKFITNGRIIQFRAEGPKWAGFWETRIDWVDGTLRTPFQATPDGGKPIDSFPGKPAPPAGVVHDLTTNLVLGDAPKLTMTFGGVTQEISAEATGPLTRAQIAVGTVATSPFEPHDVRFESMTCEMCLAR